MPITDAILIFFYFGKMSCKVSEVKPPKKSFLVADILEFHKKINSEEGVKNEPDVEPILETNSTMKEAFWPATVPYLSRLSMPNPINGFSNFGRSDFSHVYQNFTPSFKRK